MNFRTATLLVLGMFGSFTLVITTMMILFWAPEGKKTEPQQPEPKTRSTAELDKPEPVQTAPVLSEPDQKEVTAPETLIAADDEAAIPPSQTAQPAEPGAKGKKAPIGVPVRRPGRMTQKNLEIEQDEMKLLRAEMERRLKEQSLNREKKMDQLARRCETLEAGEAVQVLTILEDEHLRQVLKRMNREKALQIAALLERLGRGKAISLK
jgi:hypothetical protein